MLRARYISHPLSFIRPAGTSRGVLRDKQCLYIELTNEDGLSGIGEVSFIPGLSVENPEELEIHVDHICKLISRGEMDPARALPSKPGIQFALETALQDLRSGGKSILYPSAFTDGKTGIPTNGLIWMGGKAFMLEQIRSKMKAGFKVLKMKVGALDFSEETSVLQWIRSEYGSNELEIRLDANGAWEPREAREKLEILAGFGIHSIEQPIAAGRAEAMAELSRERIIDIALDEELIGIAVSKERERLLQQIKPQYIILKPGLLGGVTAAEDWIWYTGERKIGWWITSALESNIGLNAIAQWTAQLGQVMPQGLGTGSLYRNNIASPLQMEGDLLWYRPDRKWDLDQLDPEK